MDERGLTISLRTKPAQVCFCNEGWICEAHPDRGWPHDECVGPGVPSPVCQPAEGRPRMPQGWVSFVSTEGDD